MNPHRIATALRLLADAIEEGGDILPPKTLPLAPPAEEKEVLTRYEAAELLALTPKQVVRFVKERKLPAVKMGRGWRFRRSQLLTWLAAQGQGAH